MWTVVAAILLVALTVFAWLKSQKSAGNTKPDLEKKFAPTDGITFFDNSMSPCARRVRATLYEKGVEHRVVDVDLIAKENRHPSYLAINPLGKVPAVVVHNVKGIPDCCLFESNAITEWLDEQFPDTVQLYPSDPWERAQVKMWQRWEGAMAEDFWRMMYSNTAGFFHRAMHSRSDFEKSLPKGDPYHIAKMMKTYDGELLTPKQMHTTGIRLFQWLDLLEIALDGKQYLCGNSFSTADISVLPRVLMYPMIEFLKTDEEHRRYPNLIRYMDRMATRKSILASDRLGKSKSVVPYPWPLIEWIGNWRSGKIHHRVYGRDILRELGPIKNQQGVPTEQMSKVLYHHATWPASIMARIACLELSIQAEMRNVNMLHLEQRSTKYLALNPIGEVPTVCHDSRVVYDPMNIIEYLNATFSDSSDASLLPADATDRIHVRMWQGWMNTSLDYQLVHLYRKYIVAPILKSEFSTKESLLEALHKSTTAPEYVNDIIDVFNDDLSSEEIESKVAPYKGGLEKALEYLDGELNGKEYLVGSKLSAADISVFSMLMLFKWVGIDISGGRFPNTAAWMERLTAVPSFSTALNEVDEYMHSHGLHPRC